MKHKHNWHYLRIDGSICKNKHKYCYQEDAEHTTTREWICDCGKRKVVKEK